MVLAINITAIIYLYFFREITDFTYLFLLTWVSARMTRRK